MIAFVPKGKYSRANREQSVAAGLAGAQVGRWTVMADAGKHYGKSGFCLCQCNCGTWRVISTQHLWSSATKSCGCLKAERSARRKSGEYSIWHGMIQRCLNPKTPNFHRYGGRGISVCERWRSYDLFLKDMGERPSSAHSLGRMNNNWGYAPINCRWETRAEQNSNTCRQPEPLEFRDMAYFIERQWKVRAA